MIVVLSYYSDGSGTPVVEFFANSPNQASEVAAYIACETQHKVVNIYEIDDLADYPSKIHPPE